MKVQILSVCLLVSASATPIFTNSGSASVTCQWTGDVPPPGGVFTKTYTAPGPGADLACPASDPLYVGPFFSGGAGDLSAGVGQGGGYLVGTSRFDFKSTATDTITFPGSGPAQAVITLDLTWGAGNDAGAFEDDTADFWLNGTKVWSAEKFGFNIEIPQFTTHQIVLTEPIELGSPFSYQADVELTGGGVGFGYGGVTLVIDSIASITTPEPNALWLVAVGLAGMLLSLRFFVTSRCCNKALCNPRLRSESVESRPD